MANPKGNELIGVTSITQLYRSNEGYWGDLEQEQEANLELMAGLKRHSLFFDKIYLSISEMQEHFLSTTDIWPEIEWLMDHNIVFSTEIDPPNDDETLAFNKYLSQIGLGNEIFTEFKRRAEQMEDARNKVFRALKLESGITEAAFYKSIKSVKAPESIIKHLLAANPRELMKIGKFEKEKRNLEKERERLKKEKLALGKEGETTSNELELHEIELKLVQNEIKRLENETKRQKHDMKVLEDMEKNLKDIHKPTLETSSQFDSIYLRLLALILSFRSSVDAIPIAQYSDFINNAPYTKKSEAIQVIIDQLPLPSGETSWEQIIEYREDPKSRSNLLNLRRWIRKISLENLSVTEIQEELEWLLNEFDESMKLHKMKANTDALEAIINVPLELLELKFSNITKPFFALRKRKIALLEAEASSQGRELAYIIDTRENFGT